MIDRGELLEELLKFKQEPVIVEGKKDRAALAALGFEKIFQIHRGQSLVEFVEGLQEFNRVAILTDLDQQGKILRKKLLKLFGPYGVHEIREPREIIARMKLSHVEGLAVLSKEHLDY